MAKRGRRATNEERVRAVQLIESGRHPREVADFLNVGESTVLEWMRNYRAGGLDALSTKFASGRPTRLSDPQSLELLTLLIGCDPRQLSFGFALWTRSMVRDLIRQRFSVVMSEVSVGRLLKKLGMSAQRPTYRSYKQDPDRVRKWKEVEYPALRSRAKAEGAKIFFADEAGVRTDHHAGTTWAQVGKTPVVRNSGQRHSITMVSAIDTQGVLRFRLHEGRFRAAHFIEFCKQLLHDSSTPVYLVVDGSSVHTAREVREYVASTEGRLQLFFLPPYSPELNPDEWVWKNVKNDRIGRAGVRGREDLKAVALGALRRLQKLPHIVRGFFGDPNLAYIAE